MREAEHAGLAPLDRLAGLGVQHLPEVELRVQVHLALLVALEERGAQLAAGMRDAAKSANVPVQFNQCGSMFCGYFTSEPVHNVAEAMKSDRERFKKYFHGLLEEGIYLAPSQFEAGFLSTAHTAADIEQHFALKGTKVIGFKKSALAQAIYAELKPHRINKTFFGGSNSATIKT